MSQNPFEPGQPERSPKEQEDFLKAISALPEVTKPQEVFCKTLAGHSGQIKSDGAHFYGCFCGCKP